MSGKRPPNKKPTQNSPSPHFEGTFSPHKKSSGDFSIKPQESISESSIALLDNSKSVIEKEIIRSAMANEGAIDLDNIDLFKDARETLNCLEFLFITLSQKMNLQPKQVSTHTTNKHTLPNKNSLSYYIGSWTTC